MEKSNFGFRAAGPGFFADLHNIMFAYLQTCLKYDRCQLKSPDDEQGFDWSQL